MPDPRRHAAALLAVLLLASPSAAFADSTLLAQIEDATPELAQNQPPLSDDLPEGPDDDDGGDDGNDPQPRRDREPEPLPDTGIESGLLALLGLGLIATGSGLRLRLGRGGNGL